jgi:prepilin-type processing-associated H-X9-DG protein
LNYRVGTMDLHSTWDDWSRGYSFFSMHPSGAGFSMCDGSVQFVNDLIDIRVYRGLATIAGGENVAVP